MKRAIVFLVALLAAAVAFWMWRSGEQTEQVMTESAAPAPTRVVRLDVGLDPEEEEVWHHHDEGGGFLPLSFFHALEDAETGKPFIEALPRFGLVADPSDELGLPIGMSAGRLPTAPNDSLLVGVTCAGCHSGQFSYQGTAMTIDGAPNMLDFEALLDALTTSLEEVVSSPRKLFRMIHTMMEWEHRIEEEGELFEMHPSALGLITETAGADDDHPLSELRDHLEAGIHNAYHAETPEAGAAHLEKAAGDLPRVDHDVNGAGAEAWEHLRGALSTFYADLGFFRRHAERLVTLHKAFDQETIGGPGRADSFDAIWDLLVQTDQVTPMDAPVSIPHLFDYATFHWVHWDGNSSAVMGRDYAQAIALGADFISETNESTVLARNLIALEQAARSFAAPAWPAEILGPIDQAKAVRGEQIYARHCLECHAQETLIPVEEIGTDPQRAMKFAALEQDGKSYAEILIELGGAVSRAGFAAHGITEAELEPIERSDNPTWRITDAYQTRRLSGIWASPPYLHNGSVPTLWDLLQPWSERPAEFQVGRELDPRNVGIDATHQPQGGWTYRAEEIGNSNAGHEYGVDLSAEEKWDLVEYLKTL